MKAITLGLLAATFACSAVQAEEMKNPLSVHVLNLQSGQPSQGVTVTLDKKEGDQWVSLSSAVTNQQGRISALYPQGQKLSKGDYRVTFKTGDYYAQQKMDTLFPEIPVLIHVEKVNEHYHVPLLLSQYGFSTYRGS